MSELNRFSLSVLVGRAAAEIGEMITGACASVLRYQSKNPYVTTHERGSLLRNLYERNCAVFENELKVSTQAISASGTSAMTARLKAVHAIAMFESVSRVENMCFVAENKHSEAWKKVNSLVGSLKEHIKSPESGISSLRETTDACESLLNRVAQDCHSVLAKAESALALKTIAESMSSLSYKVSTQGSDLVASKGLFSVRANVQNGTVTLDSTSFPGVSCHAEIHKIEKELKDRGLVVRRLHEHRNNLRNDKAALRSPFPAFSAQRAESTKSVEVPPKAPKSVHAKPKQTPTELLSQVGQSNMIRER